MTRLLRDFSSSTALLFLMPFFLFFTLTLFKFFLFFNALSQIIIKTGVRVEIDGAEGVLGARKTRKVATTSSPRQEKHVRTLLLACGGGQGNSPDRVSVADINYVLNSITKVIGKATGWISMLKSTWCYTAISRVRREVSERIFPPRRSFEKRAIGWKRTRFVFVEILER